MMSYLKEGLALGAFIDDGFRVGPVLAVRRIHLELSTLEPEWKQRME